MVGTYETFMQWRYNGPGYGDYGSVTVEPGGTVVDSVGDSGTWHQTGERITMRFKAPGCTILHGRRDGSGFDSLARPGHMHCPGGKREGMYGTWYATTVS